MKANKSATKDLVQVWNYKGKDMLIDGLTLGQMRNLLKLIATCNSEVFICGQKVKLRGNNNNLVPKLSKKDKFVFQYIKQHPFSGYSYLINQIKHELDCKTIHIANSINRLLRYNMIYEVELIPDFKSYRASDIIYNWFKEQF